MTDEALHDAIIADPTAKALADAGSDLGCSARMAAILPPTVASTRLAEGGILLCLGPTAGDAALSAIEATSRVTDPNDPRHGFASILARIVRLIQDRDGCDFGDPQVRGMLDTLAASGILAPASVAKLKGAAESPAAVSAGDISRVMASSRTGNLIGGQ